MPGRDPVAYMLEGRKGETLKEASKLTYDLKRNIDVEYQRRAFVSSTISRRRGILSSSTSTTR